MNDQGRFRCPKCGSDMKPMRKGNGWSCAVPGNRWNGKGWSICDGVIWNKSTFTARKVVERADDWRIIATPTDEQRTIDADMAKSPQARGSRLSIWDAGPGCGKSSTAAHVGRTIYNRVGDLQNWHVCAFGCNSRDDLSKKYPALWQNVSTVNGFGGRQQGYSARSYKPGKLSKIFKDLTSDLPPKERPKFGPVRAFAEKVRDQLLFSTTTDKGYWGSVVETLAARFPSLAKLVEKNKESVVDYLGQVLQTAQRDGKTIDLSEQYSRPATEAIARTGWTMPARLIERGAVWTDADIEHFASLVRAVRVPQVAGLKVDEAQDLSLSQIVLILASTWRNGELVIIGDDKAREPGEPGYKAGQAIFGWRGAFSGSLTFVARVWLALTGETAIRRPLSKTHRLPPEHCEAVRELNSTLTSSKPRGTGKVFIAPAPAAFTAFCNLDDGKTALWLTRRNAPLASVFMACLRERKKVCLRGSPDMSGRIDSALYESAGWYDDNGEYKTSLGDCLAKLRESMDGDDGESIESFLLVVGEEILADPSILREAELTPVASVGNLKRFITYFASKDAPRVCSTVYRAKGDEADLVVVDDTEALNSSWNGDADESAAVRLVACTRSKQTMILTGPVAGCSVMGEMDFPAPAAVEFSAVQEELFS